MGHRPLSGNRASELTVAAALVGFSLAGFAAVLLLMLFFQAASYVTRPANSLSIPHDAGALTRKCRRNVPRPATVPASRGGCGAHGCNRAESCARALQGAADREARDGIRYSGAFESRGTIVRKPTVEEWTVSSQGLVGLQTVVRRGRDFTTTLRIGPYVTEHGRLNGATWHQNENGITVVDREHADRVATRTLERTNDGSVYVVLETLADGTVRRSTIDAHTYALIRREHWVAGRYSYTAWDDFRPESGGHVFAWHAHGDDADGGTFDQRLHSVHEGTSADEAQLDIPRNRRVLVEFPNGARSADRRRASAQAHLRARQHRPPCVRFSARQRRIGHVVGNDTARQLGLESRGSGNATGAAQVSAGRVLVRSMEIGGLHIRDIYARTVQFPDEDRREHVAGLLGFDFIASIVLRIDYEHALLDAYDSGTFQTPNGTTSVDLRLDDQVPMATLRVGRSIGDDFLVDTGASTTLLLFAHFAHSHPHDVADNAVGASLAASGIGVAAAGIGGRFVIHSVQVKRLRLGATTFNDPLVYVADAPSVLGSGTSDGLIGAEILSHYRVFLDYVRYRMLLEPPSK